MKHESITSLPPSPAVERRNRMLEYTVMMSIRVLCLISLIWVRGWWLVIPAAGAIFLPYFAVVVANAARPRGSTPERPGTVATLNPQPATPTGDQETTDPSTSDSAGAEADGASQNGAGSSTTDSDAGASDSEGDGNGTP
ncbi:DUF3099 domain-containing protein [Rathayibacter sp. CAU 1779]